MVKMFNIGNNLDFHLYYTRIKSTNINVAWHT